MFISEYIPEMLGMVLIGTGFIAFVIPYRLGPELINKLNSVEAQLDSLKIEISEIKKEIGASQFEKTETRNTEIS